MRKLVLAILLLAMLTGCFGESCRTYAPAASMTPADVVGSWQHEASGALLHFAADGSFEASDIAERLYSGDLEKYRPSPFDQSRDRLDGSGTWQLERDKSGAMSVINLRITALSVGPRTVPESRITSLYAQLGESTVVLGGIGRTHAKCSNDCKPAPESTAPGEGRRSPTR
ncbi:membrane lipoprotein lipid attachment site-containing protein [Micromonospora sp. NPDC005087]|uniref:membrane lipoprotein lipid attachment site-containing protein n=1 Tax=Micromonospora sp. NPDC005087 TaxID=3364225 RepID=UPI00369EE76A